jgi:peptidoglycan/LPS O-acetylase OafA/YrhL
LSWFSARSALLVMGALLIADYWAERMAIAGYPGRILTSFAAPIGFGALLAIVLNERFAFDALGHLLGKPWSAPLALGGVFALLLWPAAPLLLFQATLALLVGACVMREQHGLAWLLRARPISYIGTLSYGLYLLNSTAVGVVHRAFPAHQSASGFVFFTSLPLALVLAALSHRYFEAPVRRLRERFPSPDQAR